MPTKEEAIQAAIAAKKAKTPTTPPPGLNMTRIRQMKADHDAKRSSDFFKFPEGDTRMLVVMSPAPEDDTFFVEDVFTALPTFDELGTVQMKKKEFYTSPKAIDPDAYCPVGAAIDATQNRTDLPEAVRKTIWYQRRFISNAYVFKGENRWDHVILQYPTTVWDEIVNAIEAEMSAGGSVADGQSIVDPANPRLIQVTRTGAGFNTRYSVTVTSRSVPVPTELQAKRSTLGKFIKPSDPKKVEDHLAKLCGAASYHELLTTDPRAASEVRVDEVVNPSAVASEAAIMADIPDATPAAVAEPAPEAPVPAPDAPSESEPIPTCIGEFEAGLREERKCGTCSYEQECTQFSVTP